MKYLIRESQFEKVIFKYLDSLELGIDENSSAWVFYQQSRITDGETGRVIVCFKHDLGCFIDSDFAQDICDVFSLTPEKSIEVIGKWIDSKLGITIRDVYSDFFAD